MLKGRYVALLVVDLHVESDSLEPARTRLHDGTMDKALTDWLQEKFGDGGTVQLTRQVADLYEVGENDAEI